MNQMFRNLLFNNEPKFYMYCHFFKPIIDFSLSFLSLLIVSPILLIFVVLLWFANNRKVFFIQTRPGKGGRLFNILKFRTMNDKCDINGNLLPDAVRLTKIGRFIRSTSIDELPQLINVLKGEMSLVGPRPLLVSYLSLYSEEQARRHEVKPGLTGWSQVNGRNALGWDEKFKLDIWYVDNLSFGLDIKIIFSTILKVFATQGINNHEAATMPPFIGSNLKK